MENNENGGGYVSEVSINKRNGYGRTENDLLLKTNGNNGCEDGEIVEGHLDVEEDLGNIQ
jgi:hypothetical protein